MGLSRAALFLAVSWLAPAEAFALSAGEVLVVVNARSPLSTEIGAYYAEVRQVPPAQVVRIRTAPREEIDRETYAREVETPIGAYLTRHGLRDRILALALTKGVPLKIRGTGGRLGTQASVDSELALLPRVLTKGPVPLEGRVLNPYFRPRVPAPFSRAEGDIYLVTRLDAYSREDVRGLVDRAVAAAGGGKVVLDMKAALPFSGEAPGDAWLREAAARLRDRGLEVRLDETTAVVRGETDVIGYGGWGSNDPANRERTPGFRWLPGAIASWFVSTSARTFVSPPPGWRIGTWRDPGTFHAGSPQSLIGDLVAEGVTGAVGFVYEPYLDGCARPEILFPAYVAGYTLAESFYMALPYLSWQGVVIGDPLVAPFARR